MVLLLSDDIARSVEGWMELEPTAAECIDGESGEIDCAVIPHEVRTIIEPFSELWNRTVFRKAIGIHMLNDEGRTWDDLIKAFHDSRQDSAKVC